MSHSALLVDRLNRSLAAWKQLRPEKKFGGLTAELYEAELALAAQARAELAEAERLYSEALARRNQAHVRARMVHQRVVNSIKGDPDEGPDGALYIACGYLAVSGRKRSPRKKKIVEMPSQTRAVQMAV